MECRICPRRCGAEREKGVRGICGMAADIIISRAALHMWEEPPVSGSRGSGTIFFSGCPLGCVFCQNKEISRGGVGRAVSSGRLADIMLELKEAGAHNINLVTPTHFAHMLVPVLKAVKPKLGIPIAYNCGGYELVSTLRALEGLIDIYLPDIKYYSSDISGKYSGAPDYFEFALPAIAEMYRQRGSVRFDGDGILQSGMIVRHLVLPGCRKDSAELLRRLAEVVPPQDILLSLMSQYTPSFAGDCDIPALRRRVTSFEYDSVLDAAGALGFEGYCQARSSAASAYTPDFNLTGV